LRDQGLCIEPSVFAILPRGSITQRVEGPNRSLQCDYTGGWKPCQDISQAIAERLWLLHRVLYVYDTAARQYHTEEQKGPNQSIKYDCTGGWKPCREVFPVIAEGLGSLHRALCVGDTAVRQCHTEVQKDPICFSRTIIPEGGKLVKMFSKYLQTD